MVEKIISFLDRFSDKHLIPSFVSIVATGILYCFTPTDFSILNKLGKEFYLLLLFASFFLITKFVIWLGSNLISILKNYYYKRNREKDEEKQNINDIRNLVDSLAPNERKLLDYFLKNNNKEIITADPLYGNKLISYYCDSCHVILDNEVETIDTVNLKPLIFQKGYYVYKHKLKSELYDYLKFMVDKNINISNF